MQLTEIGTPMTNLGAMSCPLARQFARWTREAVRPAARRFLGSEVRRIESFGTYSCRGVNGQPGARLSEHAFANAVDVSAFVLADGRRITVLDGWNGGDERGAAIPARGPQAGCRRFAVALVAGSQRLSPQPFPFRHGPRPLLPLSALRLMTDPEYPQARLPRRAREEAEAAGAGDAKARRPLDPAYRLAFQDMDFLLREDLRPVRFQLELLKPELLLDEAKIASTFVFYGSARIPEPAKADALIAAAATDSQRRDRRAAQGQVEIL